jgi:hypothetical protein
MNNNRLSTFTGIKVNRPPGAARLSSAMEGAALEELIVDINNLLLAPLRY